MQAYFDLLYFNGFPFTLSFEKGWGQEVNYIRISCKVKTFRSIQEGPQRLEGSNEEYSVENSNDYNNHGLGRGEQNVPRSRTGS